MGIENNKNFKNYIDNVCLQVKNREMHHEIELELKNHIEELSEEYMLQSLPEEEALEKAILEMGDSAAVGKKFNAIYKPRTDWGIVVLVLLFAGTGLLTMYSVEATGALYRSPSQLFNKTLLFNLMGTLAAVLLYFFDYRKIKPFSKHIYIGTLAVLSLTLFSGGSVNGIKYISIGPFNINFVAISPVLLIIALAGIFDQWDFKSPKEISLSIKFSKSRTWEVSLNSPLQIILVLFMMFVPAILMLAYPSITSAGIYCTSFMVLLAVAGVKLKYVLSIAASGIVMFLLLIFTGPAYRMERFLIFLNPESDPMGAGYIFVQIKKVLHSAGLLGQGFNFNPQILPEVHTDFILTYIIYTFGWAAGILLILLIGAFILRITGIAKMTRNSYGKLLVSGFGSIFTVQFIWNILMTLGLAPLVGMGLPFISYGGSQFLINMAAAGLILSIYRRKRAKSIVVK